MEVHTRVLAAKGARVEAEQVVKRQGDDIARLSLEIACVDLGAMSPTPIPDSLLAALETLK